MSYLYASIYVITAIPEHVIEDLYLFYILIHYHRRVLVMSVCDKGVSQTRIDYARL
jgi:hypothetical protein